MSGKIMPALFARVLRGDEELAETEVTRVQRQQQEAKEVFEGEMCGISLRSTGKLLLEEGDRVEVFQRELRKRTL